MQPAPAIAPPGVTGVAAAPVRRPRTRALIVLCCTLAAAALVAGAAGFRAADTDETVLRGFQIRVLSISQAAAENRMDGALAALQALEKDLGDAAAAGRLSAARYRGIETALSAVKADITRQVAAVAPPATPAPDQDAAAPTLAGTAASEPAPAPAPADAAVPAVAPAPAPAAEVPGTQRSDTAKEAKDRNKGKGADSGQGRP